MSASVHAAPAARFSCISSSRRNHCSTVCFGDRPFRRGSPSWSRTNCGTSWLAIATSLARPGAPWFSCSRANARSLRITLRVVRSLTRIWSTFDSPMFELSRAYIADISAKMVRSASVTLSSLERTEA